MKRVIFLLAFLFLCLEPSFGSARNNLRIDGPQTISVSATEFTIVLSVKNKDIIDYAYLQIPSKEYQYVRTSNLTLSQEYHGNWYLDMMYNNNNFVIALQAKSDHSKQPSDQWSQIVSVQIVIKTQLYIGQELKFYFGDNSGLTGLNNTPLSVDLGEPLIVKVVGPDDDPPDSKEDIFLAKQMYGINSNKNECPEFCILNMVDNFNNQFTDLDSIIIKITHKDVDGVINFSHYANGTRFANGSDAKVDLYTFYTDEYPSNPAGSYHARIKIVGAAHNSPFSLDQGNYNFVQHYYRILDNYNGAYRPGEILTFNFEIEVFPHNKNKELNYNKKYTAYIKFDENYNAVKEFEKNELNIQIFPNPVINQATIKFDLLQKEKLTLLINNTQGIQVWKEQLSNLQPGANNIDFHRNDLPAGVYFYKLQGTNSLKTGKIIIY